MKVTAIRSDIIYQKIMAAPAEQKDDIYRYELMASFQKKWDCYHIPLKVTNPGGYDIIMASDMMGLLPPRSIRQNREDAIRQLSNETLWKRCQESVERSLNCFVKAQIPLRQDYLFTIFLANETNAYTIMNEGYCGDGGIPGYILAWLVPNDYTIERLPVALAHEVNHNVRFQFIKWRNDITLGEMMVSEGLAENFATWLYGDQYAGPWVTKTDLQELNNSIKPVIHDGLSVQGLMEMNAYLYGDEMAVMHGCPSVGLPYCAGYACGYHLVKYYLQKTGKSIVDATLLPAEEILKDAEDFWNER